MINLQELNQRLEEIEREKSGDTLEKALFDEMKEYKGDDRVVSFKDYLEIHKEEKNRHIQTSIGSLDEITGGVGKGDIITITADTGEGKTSFARQLTRNFAKNGNKSLWFSYEETNSEFLSKFGENLPEGYLPIFANDTSTVWIERKIVEAIAKYQVEIVFIDNISFLADLATKNNLSSQIGSIIHSLKRIAVKYNIVIFLIAHIAKQKDDETIDKHSIRDSKTIADVSSVIIALWRNKEKQTKIDRLENGIKYTNKTTVSICKNRYGGIHKSFKMTFNNNYFAEENYEIS